MKKIKKYCCFIAVVMSQTTFALEAMDDADLSASTGQDGFNINLGVSRVQINQASIIDNNGLPADHLLKASANYAAAASYVLAGTAANTPVTLDFIGANASPTIQMSLDTDGNNGHPFSNINFKFGQNISGISLSPFAIYLAGVNSTSTPTTQKLIYTGAVLNSDVYKLLTVGSASNKLDILFHDTNKPSMNIQLGNAPQNRMFLFHGAIKAICSTSCPISLISGSTSASFDFKMTATDQTTGFLLDNFYAGFEPSGMVIGNTGTSSKMDIGINNLMLGVQGQTDTSFAGLSNSTMGSFGLSGASVTNLKTTIKGM